MNWHANLGPLVRFLTVGGISTVSHLGVAVTSVEIFGINPQLSNMAGFLTSVVVSFTGNHTWTFRGHSQPIPFAFARYAAVLLIGAGYSAAAMYITTARLIADYTYGLAFIVITWPILSFILSRTWVFRAAAER